MPPKGSKRKIKKCEREETRKEEEPILVENQAEDTTDEHEQHIIVQLSIKEDRINELLQGTNIQTKISYNPVLNDPIPYDPSNNNFTSAHDAFDGFDFPSEGTKSVRGCKPSNSDKYAQEESEMMNSIEDFVAQDILETKQQPMCFWCCHEIGVKKYGMPSAYDTVHKNFHAFGTFCSLECASAYNFSVHMGSDRLWDINSWIQLMARQNNINTPIRPAPSRYVLKKFGGAININDFRQAHKSFAKTYVYNIPPLINVVPQIEAVNSSFLSLKAGASFDIGEKTKLIRRKSIVDKKRTLETKMNLTYNHE